MTPAKHPLPELRRLLRASMRRSASFRRTSVRLTRAFAGKDGLAGFVLFLALVCALPSFASNASTRMGVGFVRARGEASLRSEPTSAKLPSITSSIADIPAAFDDDAAMRPRAESVVDYTLRASLDPVRHIVHGEGTILFRNTSRKAITELYFHLYLNAFEDEHTVFFRTPSHGGRGTGRLDGEGHIQVHELCAPDLGGQDLWAKADRHSPGDPRDRTDIRVPLPEPLAPGDSLRLEVAWEAKLPRVSFRTGHSGSFHMVAQWFPKLARLEADGDFAHFPFHRLSEFYADFGSYDVTIDVPEGFVVGATGSRIETGREGGRLRHRYVQDSVHDFAFTAWDGFREREAVVEGVTIRALFPPGYESVAERQIETAKFGLRRFGEAFGAYPYSTLTLVHPPASAEEAGGMEYPTLITTGGAWFLPRALRSIEHLTLHELGHQYFYGLVATNEHAWPFLDEGVNSYVESVFLEELLGKGSYLDAFGLKLGIAEGHRIFAVDRGHRAPVAQPAPDFGNGADYAALVYSRTATILQTFARVYGEDELMRALGRYARRYRFEHPGFEEFVAALRPLGEGVEQNLRSALLERGFVDYAVESASSAPSQRLGEWEGEALVSRRGSLVFPVEIELVAEDGTKSRHSWDGQGDSIRIPYRGKSPLASATVDPETRVFLDEDLFNNAFRIDEQSLAPRALERLVYFTELLLHGLMP